jgi:hypothetical protein
LGSAGTNPAINFIGTTDAQPFVVRTGDVQSLRIEPTSVLFNGASVTANVIAGSGANSVTAGVRGATISGGGYPAGFNDPDFGSGAPNRVTDSYGTVSGGYSNQAGDGAGSTSGAAGATVSGGYVNNALGNLSTVGGGFFNNASADNSTVSGGVSNIASGGTSTVSGGNANTASGSFSSVSGGFSNTASGNQSTVSGGRSNEASGTVSVVSGGEFNAATGVGSFLSGGRSNCAGGDYSWAGGRSAGVRPGNEAGDGSCVANNSGDADGDNGTFVWSDDQGIGFTSTGPRQFLVRAQGGMAINTNTPAADAALTVNGNVAIANTGSLEFGLQNRQMLNLVGSGYGIGVQTSRMYFRTISGFSWFEDGVHSNTTDNPGAGGTLHMRLSTDGQLQTTTGTISTLSDARLKDQVVDYAGALDQINALHPVRYHYRDAGKAAFQAEGLHLGFVAQEVQQVFPEWVSAGEDGYLMLSMRGFEAVAVRAMQELSARDSLAADELARVSAQNDALRIESAALRAELERRDADYQSRLARLEALIGARRSGGH